MSLIETNSINGFDSEPCEVIDVTYTELVELMALSQLDPCATYRITDFQTLHKLQAASERNDTNVTIPIEVLRVKPSSTSTIFNNVQSESYPNDLIEYTTDNTAWKDLQIAGQKGCITLRIDTLSNVKIGNGDWRNFIVRRWAVDLSAYNRGAIRWLLWDTSVSCGVLTTGGSQTLTALDTNLYNAATNPDGYRDFRLYGEIDITEINNVNIAYRAVTPTPNNYFEMPNFFIEKVGGYTFATYSITNVNIESCNNVSFTTCIKDVGITSIRSSIFADAIEQPNMLFGFFDLTLFVIYLTVEGNIGNLVSCTIWENTHGYQKTAQLTVVNCRFCYINFTGTGDLNLSTVENCQYVYVKINKQSANSYILRNFAYHTIIPAWNGNICKDLSAYTTNLKYDTISNSTIQTSAAAAAAITLSSATTAAVLDMFAGIINLTGSGTVNIDTLTRFLPNNFTITLVPASGLTIKIPTNNVANGFIQNETFVADGTLGEKLILMPVGDRWMVTAGNVVGSFIGAAYSATQLDKVANITLADIPNLTANLKAGQAYAFKAKLFVDADAVGGYSIGVNGTAGINNLIWQVDAINNTTNLFTLNSRQTTFVGTGAVGGTSIIAYISGTIVVSTAGTLKLQFSQSVANGTSSVLVGSSFEVQQLN